MKLCYLRTLLLSSIFISFIPARHTRRAVKARGRSVQHKLQQNQQFLEKQQHLQHLQNSGLSDSEVEEILSTYNNQYESSHNSIPVDSAFKENTPILDDQKSNLIPQKEEIIKPMESFMITNKPDTSMSTTSELYPSTPPWQRQHALYNKYHLYNKYNKDAVPNVYEDVMHNISESYATNAMSTTSDRTQCPCGDIQNDKLLTILTNPDSPDHYDQRRLDLLKMGLYSAEQARRCYQFCTNRSPSMSFSYSTKNMQTYPSANRKPIEMVTESVDPKDFNYDRHHCYEIMLSKSETNFCMFANYTPTEDSPKPSTNPKGQNIWKCCKKIPTYKAYYNY